MLFKRIVSTLLIVSLLAPTLGCFATKTKPIEQALAKLSTYFEREARRGPLQLSPARMEWARQLRGIGDSAIRDLIRAPDFVNELRADLSALEMIDYVERNRIAISVWLEQVEASGKALRSLIYDISKSAYESPDDREISRHYALLLLALHYHRAFYQQMMEMAAPIAFALAVPAYDEVSEIVAFRKTVADSVLSFLGAKVVTDQDLGKALGVLTEYRKNAILPEEIIGIISGLQKSVKPSAQPAFEQSNDVERARLMQTIKEFRGAFQGKTLFYTPGAKRSAIVDFLAWVGNLSWGSINSVVGVGIILTAILASPFLLSFPTFALSRNGKQFYVDVTPLGNRGKLSMGIFEFGAFVNPGFASGHEGGHALQSAILGPFYLPAILATYAIYGFDKGPMEDWAWNWQDA